MCQIPGSGKSSGEGIGYPLQCSWASLMAQLVKESAHNAGDLGWIPGLGRSLGEGKGYPLQHSGLENYTDSIVHEVAKRQTRLSDFHFQIHPRGRLTRAAAAWSPPQAVLDRSPGSCLLTSPPGFGHRWLFHSPPPPPTTLPRSQAWTP